MIRFIYIFLALLAIGCVRQANTTHPKDDVAPIDSTSAVTNDGYENTVQTDSAENTITRTDSVSTLTDSASTNLQNTKAYNDREITTTSFNKDTIETALSSGLVKTFLTEDKNEIVKFHMMEDTILYTGTKANAIISNHDRADTIIITRSLLAKHISDIDEFEIDIAEFEIFHINYLYEKGDTICFWITLNKPDTDYSIDFKYYHTNDNDYIEEYYNEEWESENDYSERYYNEE